MNKAKREGVPPITDADVERSMPTTFKEKYVAIKLHAMWPWLWFDSAKVIEKDGMFIGKGGWGKGGALTEVCIDSRLIVGRIESKELQYMDS